MNLQTNIKFDKQPHHQIDYNSKLMLLGSCFSENIGSKFEYFKFQSEVNPLGILFHPIAIENLIARSINRDFYTEDELLCHNETWSSFDAHSRLNSVSRDGLLNNLNQKIEITHQKINTATHIVITLGTAWIYRHVALDKIVANCHKIPQKQFLKELLSIEEIIASLENTIALIRSINPKVSFIYTVSPVRHLKDGFVENNRSKAHLLSAIHHIVEPRKLLFYFPSYEIMMDELRDYRFYNQDMVHPNDLAIDYIWEKFKTVWISKNSEDVMNTVKDIQQGLRHKPFNINSVEYQTFLNHLKLKIKQIKSLHNFIDFNEVIS